MIDRSKNAYVERVRDHRALLKVLDVVEPGEERDRIKALVKVFECASTPIDKTEFGEVIRELFTLIEEAAALCRRELEGSTHFDSYDVDQAMFWNNYRNLCGF